MSTTAVPGPPDRSAPASSSSWRWAGYALALALPLLLGLGAPLYDVDEGAFSEATREMLASGDFGHTTLNGAPRFDKPILVYWLQAASMALFGPSEWAVRLPSALCAWLSALALGAFVAPRVGRDKALLAGVIMVTALGPWALARAATADALLNLLRMLAALDLWRHLEHGARAPLRSAALWIGFGLLTKGPVALLIPAATLGLWATSRRDRRALGRALSDPWPWLIVLVVALPWYAYAWQRHGMAFVEGFILKHNVGRFSGPMEGHGGSLGYYLLVTPLMWLPWSPLWLGVLARLRSLWREPYTRYLLVWAGFVLAFFSLSGTKLPHYSLYAGPALALLTVQVWDQAGRTLRAVLWVGLATLLLTLALLPWLLGSGWIDVRNPLYAALLQGAPPPWWPSLAYAVAAVALLWLLATRRWGFLPRFALAAWALTLATAGFGAPWWGEALQGPIKRGAEFARGWMATQPGARVQAVQWQTHWPSTGFYLRQAVPQNVPAPGELAFTRTDRLQRSDEPMKLESLWQERGVSVVRRIE